MPEHYTKNTVECSVWCAKCGCFTPHRVDGGRRGPCLRCLAALASAPRPEPAVAEQMNFFGRRE